MTSLHIGLRLLIATFPILTLAEDAPPVSDFIRYVEPSENAPSEKLETAVVRFQNPTSGVIVDLIAVIHIGDRAYFEKLNSAMQSYHTVYYEAVGGEIQKKPQPTEASLRRPKAQFPQTSAQQAISYLGLVHQRNVINYEAANFVHADLSWKELFDLMEVRNQSVTSTFQRLNKINPAKSGSGGMVGAFTGRLTGGDPLAFKRSLARSMSDGEKTIAKLESEGGTVIVTERNKAVIAKLAPELNTPAVPESPPKKLAILYGAGHMPDFEQRLKSLGLKPGTVTWVTAWQISEPEPSESAAVNRFLKSISRGKPGEVDATKFFGNDAKD